MFSIDQNSHSLWDTLPKLHALTAAGYRVRHFVEDIDVAFTALGGAVDDRKLRIEREQFRPSGGQDWGAALFYSEFLGRGAVEPRTFQPQLGMTLRALARQLGGSLEDIYRQYAAGDNWMLIGSSYVGDRDHHRLIGDLTVAEVEEYLREIMHLAEQDCLKAFPAADAQQRTRQWFTAERRRIEELIADGPADTLAEFYRFWLEQHLAGAVLAGAVEQNLTSHLFATGADEHQTALLEVFLQDYDTAAGLYNQAVTETDLGLHPLATKDGELPFFAVFRHHGRLVRTGVNLDGNSIRMPGRQFALRPDQRLPIEALRDAGITAIAGKAVVLAIQARVGPNGQPLALPHYGSLYMPAAHRLAVLLEQNGLLPGRLAPVVRVRFRLLDRLGALDTVIRLPDYLTRAFGTEEIHTSQLAENHAAVAAEAAERFKRFADESFRRRWQSETMPKTVQAVEELDAAKRNLAAGDPKAPRVRQLGGQLRELQNELLAATLDQVAADYQTAQLEFWDSRGAPLPWCVALGGEAFYNEVINRAEITEETHEQY